MADGDRVAAAGYASLCAGLLILAAWLSAGARLELRRPSPAPASPSQTEALISRGDYASAERSARALIASLQGDSPAGLRELAHVRDLLVEALLGGGKAGDSLTLEFAQSNLETKKRVDGLNQAGIAVSLHNLADVHFQRGEYRQALALHEAGLRMRAGLVSSDDRDIADSLERLANTQMRMERYDAARRNLEKALAIRARRVEEPIELAHSLELIAWLHRYAGDYAAAQAPLETALTTLRRFAPDHPDLVTAIEVQGDVLMLQGDIASSASTWREALAHAERTLGNQHPVISALERRIAYSDNAIGNRTEGRRRLEHALLIAERTRAQCDPELIVLINDSAGSSMFDGEYVEARKRYARTLELSERCFGPNNSNTATVVFNLAALTAQMGDFAEADRLYERAIQAWSARGSEDPYVAKGLDALAEVVETSGDPSRARDLFERALAIRRKIRADHPDVAWTLTNLARVLAASGDVPLALRDLTEASDIYKRNGTSIEPDHLARTITQRGDIHARRGDYLMARADFTEALMLRERLFGAEHPLTAESRLKAATADLALGRYDDALAAARQARENGLDHVKFTVRYLPERRALAYASRTTRGLGLELSLATMARPALPSQFFDAVIRSRSIVLDELGARTHVLGDPRPEVAAVQARLNTARQRFANLMLRSMSAEGSSLDAGLLSAGRHEREEAEQALAEQSAVFRSQLARADVGLTDVRRNLPPGSALVSFVRFNRTTLADARPSASPLHPSKTLGVEPSYVAFVLRSGDTEPSMVPLGAARGIDELVTNWRRRMIDEIATTSRPAAGQSLPELGEQLRRQVWDPLGAHIKGVSRVFVVPDGALNLVPIVALPAESGGYLIEQRPVIHYLSAERDVVRSEEPLKESTGLLAIGGPAFSDVSSFASLTGSKSQPPTPAAPDTIAANARREQPFRGSAPGCLSFQSIDFDALPGSRIEAEIIARLWNQIGLARPARPDHARLLTGSLATERAFKELSPRRRILHLATHGFFLGDECGPVIEGTRAVGGLTTAGKSAPVRTGPAGDVVENPLLLSGLALAGANKRSAAALDEEDGILTAEEVAALNLEGVEWAVLSACDTGLGTVSAGEGILGLRRAFQVAGVRTVIMSLWSVEDRAAQHWMEALYRARLVGHMDTADSVRQASLAVIRERRATGQSTHPFYWASFVAAGDWR